MKFALNLGEMAVSLYILRRNNLLEIRITIRGGKARLVCVIPDMASFEVGRGYDRQAYDGNSSELVES